MKYSNEEKLSTVARCQQGESVAALSSELSIPRSTLYRWLKSFPSDSAGKPLQFSYQEYALLQRKVEKLQNIITILKSVDKYNTKQSFSQPGKPHDNAVAESFFASLKKEELYRKDHPSDRAFQASVASYIEFYNTKRPHRTLKNLTPCQMEEQSAENIK